MLILHQLERSRIVKCRPGCKGPIASLLGSGILELVFDQIIYRYSYAIPPDWRVYTVVAAFRSATDSDPKFLYILVGWRTGM